MHQLVQIRNNENAPQNIRLCLRFEVHFTIDTELSY